jgi:hypothetical protein
LFLRDPQSDLFAIINEKIYALHRNFLGEIGEFTKEEVKGEKVHMMDAELNVPCPLIKQTHF